MKTLKKKMKEDSLINLFNINTIQAYSSANLSLTATYNSPATIVPPRVFRFGASLNF